LVKKVEEKLVFKNLEDDPIDYIVDRVERDESSDLVDEIVLENTRAWGYLISAHFAHRWHAIGVLLI